jgi:hypothetical protein
VDSRLKIAGMTRGGDVIPEIFNQESRGSGIITSSQKSENQF